MNDDGNIDDNPPPKFLMDYQDYSLGISTDGVRQSVAWKLKDYGDSGALSDHDIDVLVARFSLTRNQVRELSWTLGQELGGLPTVVLISRVKAAEAAVIEIKAAHRELAAAEKRLLSASRRLEKLLIDRDVDPITHDAFRSAKSGLADCSATLRGALETLDVVAVTPGLALQLRHVNRNVFPDHRRDKLLRSIMLFWNDVGRKLTFTTDPMTSERKGMLIDFVSDIVRCVSDPPGQLSGESIIAGIKDGKKSVKSIDSYMEEMKKVKRYT